ncbi:DedA family protein [Modestobacter sp. VKM Ac-2985]|uniref:DedA family protein n=1 Tax=Modestobacter sp. VKM Ac-2985 TaxID=3004139 RepID=UPI0022AB6AE6|nr:VTT domain-containing protein [Modestobacter sp. VKM Ac-2985]MCZ2838784.1 VTT domain-containing protein [Modestobacter sp. VKM Ac-2985]
MTDAVLGWVQELMASPWVYLVLFSLAALDGFLPVVPGESVVITAGVFAATGQPDLAAVVAVAALGAFAGDHASYLIGHRAGPRLQAWARPGGRRRAALDRAARLLAARGGVLLVTARYVPGLRTAVTLTAGAVGWPLRRFAPFAALAALTWAGWSAGIGYVGGLAFERDPLRGLLLGLGLALVLAALGEGVRILVHRRRPPVDAVAERAPAEVGAG